MGIRATFSKFFGWLLADDLCPKCGQALEECITGHYCPNCLTEKERARLPQPLDWKRIFKAMWKGFSGSFALERDTGKSCRECGGRIVSYINWVGEVRYCKDCDLLDEDF